MAATGDDRNPKASWTRFDWLALAGVTAGAAVLRLYRLTRPEVQVFDERTYVKDACFYVHAGPRPPCFDHEITTVHPPLGKWLIGWGIDITDFNALGWRIAAALAGIVTVALLYLLARRLLGSTLGAAIVAGLLAIDFMHFVHSRVGMLDIFVPLFGVAAFLFIVYDRDAPHGWRPWRIAAGVACGLAAATKWSGLLVLATVLLLTVVWEVSARAGVPRRVAFNRALAEEGGSILVGLLIVPVIVYSVTFVGRLEGSYLAWPWAHGSFYRALWDRQFYMYEFHRFLALENWAQSPVWSWPFVTRPIPYLFEELPDGYVRYLGGGADPLVWWSSLVALVYTGVAWVRRRRGVANPRDRLDDRGVANPRDRLDDRGVAEGVILAGFVVGYFPWFVLSYNRPDVFIYYMLPVVPFMCLALGYVSMRLWRSTTGRAAVVAFAAVAAGLFVLEYPLLTAQPLTESAWHARMWVYDDCESFFRATATIPPGLDNLEVDTSETLSNREAGAPAPAWCGL
jgi:dolichyl-phosphate-mannose--protein O-mannosyl transferase